MGLCVNPNLNIKGSSFRKSASVTSMACCRIAPAAAFRSHNLKLIQLNVWHLVTRASNRGESGGICWRDAGIVRSRYPILILLYLHSGLSSRFSHSRFSLAELALGWPEGKKRLWTCPWEWTFTFLNMFSETSPDPQK